MDNISTETFIKNWIPKHIKNKILFYLLESIFTKKNSYNHTFKFGINIYNTKRREYLENFLPFRQDELYVKIKNTANIFNFNVPDDSIPQLSFKKVMKSIVHEKDILKMKKVRNMAITDEAGRKTIIDYKNIDIKNAKMFKYVKMMEFGEFPCGLILREKEELYIYYEPYNNGNSRKYALYTDSNYREISISPLQMLWRIKYGGITIKALKNLAKINKIDGRSKLKTRNDFIQTFMKL
uniref:Uncharacterized protein n=1 Tax=viral metagenome TaxID=1070528 RepID=A0A6C0L2C5_9ZZZZ|tara:strand:- start:14916 stop:15629 length:714 start_codon:yes stop_codon:yes gene_type:complete